MECERSDDLRQFLVNDSRSRPQLAQTTNKTSEFAVLAGFACEMDDDVERIAAHMTELDTFSALHRVCAFLPYRRGSLLGCRNRVDRNDPRWFFKYALVQEYISVGSWRARFCISHV